MTFKKADIFFALKLSTSKGQDDLNLFTLKEDVAPEDAIEWLKDPKGPLKHKFADMSLKRWKEYVAGDRDSDRDSDSSTRKKGKGRATSTRKRPRHDRTRRDHSSDESSSKEERRKKKKGKGRAQNSEDLDD